MVFDFPNINTNGLRLCTLAKLDFLGRKIIRETRKLFAMSYCAINNCLEQQTTAKEGASFILRVFLLTRMNLVLYCIIGAKNIFSHIFVASFSSKADLPTMSQSTCFY